jgi:trehalose 6-phosphate phosphatase
MSDASSPRGPDAANPDEPVVLADPLQLAARLGPARDRLIVLDFDGVLAPIVDHPDHAAPAPGAIEAVRALAAVTTVAIVSGRPLLDLQPRLDGLPLTFAGAHGADLVYPDGEVEHLADPDDVREVLDVVEAEARGLVDDEPGWLVERKPTSLAVHRRLAQQDSVEERLPRVVALLEHHAPTAPGFEVLAGKAVLELRPTGVDKGLALERIAARTPQLQPLVVGDDVTDEDAFVVAGRLGGEAVLVAEEARATAATNRLQDPDAVVVFLTELAGTEG